MGMFRKLLVAVLTVAALPLAATAQARGTITGRVIDQSTQQPLIGAQVVVVGTNARATTNQQGTYTIPGVPAEQVQVSATRIGYNTNTRPVTVAAGQTAVVNFVLSLSAVELGGLVVTATGREQRQREIGSAVASINVAEVELAPVTNMSDLLQGRTAGVTVLQSSGTTGGGSRIRIRGNNSISLSNAPLLIIDGVRVESSEASLGFGVGGQQPSRINDINPEDIETIEILKGPSAAALYGTAAANGVIQVTTKRGRAGAPQFRAWGEYGRIERNIEFPENVTVLAANGNACPLVYQSSGVCTPATETFRFNPLENAETTPFEDGNRRVVGGSVSGGGEGATFYVSGEYQEEDGVYKQRDGLKRVNVQANLTGRVGSKLNVSSNVGFTEQDLELPLSDNALYGIVGMGVFGDADTASIRRTQGFENNPRYFTEWNTFQDLSRFTGSLRGDYRPIPWLTFNGTVGMDRIAREEVNRIPRNNIRSNAGGVFTNGFIQNYGYDISNFTTNGSGTAVFDLNEDLVSTTTAGTQYIRENFHRIYAFGAGLVPGVETSLAGATSDFSAGEDNILNATLGAFVQQQLGWRDRVFINASVRGDKNTAFGTDIGWVWYPSFSGSWVVSDESFFPSNDILSTLRLRAAYGRSGLRPGGTDALLFFNPVVTTVGTMDQTAFSISEIGNAELKPERSTETEVGFESGFFDSRLGLELTYFWKKSDNALVNVPLAPSAGSSANRFENLGEVKNSGLEILLTGQPVRRGAFELNFSLSGSWIDNELVDLGTNAVGQPIQPIILGSQRHVEGFPLGSYFQRPIATAEDANEDGVLQFGEVTLGDDFEFFGNPFPKREFALSADARLGSFVKISTLLDHKAGFQRLNFTNAWRQAFELNDAASYNPTLEQQAAQIALLKGSYAGFIEDADFVKWRELSLTLGLPKTMAQRFGSEGLSVTLAGRNLKTWTDYSGVDPEVNFAGQANFTTGEFATLPPNRLFTIRVDANF